jgi:GPI ethanolamine phosphate transferase 2/3 subunit F
MPLIDPVTMSSPSGKAGASQSSTAADNGETLLKPVHILPSSQAQAARHVHPVLLASFFLLRFNALVQDPVSTMYNSLPVVIAIQLAYSIVCLPPVGSQSAKAPKKLRPGEKKKPGAETSGPNIAVVRVDTDGLHMP